MEFTMPEVPEQVQQLSNEIVDSFKARLGERKLSPEELALIQRVAQRLASVALRLPGADDASKLALALQRDAALATLANLSVAKAIEAERLMRQAVYESIVKALQVGLGVVEALMKLAALAQMQSPRTDAAA